MNELSVSKSVIGQLISIIYLVISWNWWLDHLHFKDALESLQNKHLLSAVLLNNLESADYLLCCTAIESLSLIARLESVLGAKMVMDSPFLPALTSRLVSSFRSIPDDDHPAR